MVLNSKNGKREKEYKWQWKVDCTLHHTHPLFDVGHVANRSCASLLLTFVRTAYLSMQKRSVC